VTVVAADARPTEAVTFSECVDVNSGQRLDVEVKADQEKGTFWISGWLVACVCLIVLGRGGWVCFWGSFSLAPGLTCPFLT